LLLGKDQNKLFGDFNFSVSNSISLEVNFKFWINNGEIVYMSRANCQNMDITTAVTSCHTKNSSVTYHGEVVDMWTLSCNVNVTDPNTTNPLTWTLWISKTHGLLYIRLTYIGHRIPYRSLAYSYIDVNVILSMDVISSEGVPPPDDQFEMQCPHNKNVVN